MALNDNQKARRQNLRQKKQEGTLGNRGQNRLNRLNSLRSGSGGAGGGRDRPDVRNTNRVEGRANKAGKQVLNQSIDRLPGAMDQAFEDIDYNALPTAPWAQDLGAERQRIEDSLYGRFTKGFGDDKAQQQQDLAQNLAERGITPGSGELYEREMNRFEDQWNERFDTAKDRAVQMGGQEWRNSFDIGSAGRSQAYGEQLTDRQLPMQQMQGLMGLAQIPMQGAQGYRGQDIQYKLGQMQDATNRYNTDTMANTSMANARLNVEANKKDPPIKNPRPGG